MIKLVIMHFMIARTGYHALHDKVRGLVIMHFMIKCADWLSCTHDKVRGLVIILHDKVRGLVIMTS